MNKDNSQKTVGYHLKKIYQLERLKAQYITTSDFKNYKKVCKRQEEIIMELRSPEHQLMIQREKTPENQELAGMIRRQVEINQVLLDDLKNISQEYLRPLNSNYYDQGGNIKRAAKVFSAET